MNPMILSQTQDIARGVLANVSADQLGDPTPCKDWNVGQLIDHMVGAQHWARCGVQGVPMTETGDGSSAGDFVAAFDAAATAAATIATPRARYTATLSRWDCSTIPPAVPPALLSALARHQV